MHNLLAGLMGFFVGLGSFFHGGQGMPAQIHQNKTVQQASSSGTASPSGTFNREGGEMRKLPAGEKLFFGTVTAVNGSTLTVQMQRPMRPSQPSITPSISQTQTVTLTSTTTYTGGSQTSIAVNTRIAGMGTTNSDGSITATQVRINPTAPTGFHRRNREGNDGN